MADHCFHHSRSLEGVGTTGITQLHIRLQIGRALAVVKVTSQVNGNTQFSGSGHQKTTSAIKIKCGTTDYVREGNPQPTFGNSRITGGFTHIPYGDMDEITFLT